MPGLSHPLIDMPTPNRWPRTSSVFLNHQPLLKAGNPSRRERVGNYLKRQRPRLIRAAVFFAVMGLIVGAAGPRVYEWLTPKLESSPKFQAVVAAIEAEERGEHIRTSLEELDQQFPGSCLPLFYLAFTVDQSDSEIERFVLPALAKPGVVRTLSAWSKQHAEFCNSLVDLAEARIIRADKFALKYDVDDKKTDDDERDAELRRTGYQTANQVLLQAEKLDPSSLRIKRLLATTDVVLGRYDSAYRRFAHVVPLLPSETNEERSTFLFCLKLRGKVACLWVESERANGKASSAETLNFLLDAHKDLNRCAQWLGNNEFDVRNPVVTYYVNHDQARANLDLADVAMDLGKRDRAKQYLDKSNVIIQEMEQKCLHGLKVPKPVSLTRRWSESSLRLIELEGVASSQSSKSPSDRASTSGARSG